MLRLVVGLAARDCLHDRRLFVCFAAAFAAVLAPLLVVYGLKSGIVDHLIGGHERGKYVCLARSCPPRVWSGPLLVANGRNHDPNLNTAVLGTTLACGVVRHGHCLAESEQVHAEEGKPLHG